MQSDPLEVEVDGRPQEVNHPSTIVLFRFDEPLSILDIDDCTKSCPIFIPHSVNRGRCELLKRDSPAAGDPNRLVGSMIAPT